MSIKIIAEWKVFNDECGEVADLLMQGLNCGGFKIELMFCDGALLSLNDLIEIGRIMNDLELALQNETLQRQFGVFRSKEELKDIL